MGTGRVEQAPMGAPPMGPPAGAPPMGAPPMGASPVGNLGGPINPNVGAPVGVPLSEPIMINGVENVPVENVLPYQFM